MAGRGARVTNDSVYVGHRIAMEMPVYLIHCSDRDTDPPPSLPRIGLSFDADLARKVRTWHLRLVLHGVGIRLYRRVAIARLSRRIGARPRETNGNKSIILALYDSSESRKTLSSEKFVKQEENKARVTFFFFVHACVSFFFFFTRSTRFFKTLFANTLTSRTRRT